MQFSQCLQETFGQAFPSIIPVCWWIGIAAWVSAVIQEIVGLQIISQVKEITYHQSVIL